MVHGRLFDFSTCGATNDIPRLAVFCGDVLTMTCHVFAAMADELRQLISGPQSVYELLPREESHAVPSAVFVVVDAQPPVWSRLPASRTAQESAMTKVWERPSEPRILEVHAMQGIVGVWVVEALGAAVPGGLAADAHGCRSEDETNDGILESGITQRRSAIFGVGCHGQPTKAVTET